MKVRFVLCAPCPGFAHRRNADAHHHRCGHLRHHYHHRCLDCQGDKTLSSPQLLTPFRCRRFSLLTSMHVSCVVLYLCTVLINSQSHSHLPQALIRELIQHVALGGTFSFSISLFCFVTVVTFGFAVYCFLSGFLCIIELHMYARGIALRALRASGSPHMRTKMLSFGLVEVH